MSIAKLTEGFPITRQAITKHLRMMEDAGLVNSAQNGRESVWQLEAKRLDDAQRYLSEIAVEWDHALGRLKRLVER
jgi:DNA-binding transcriptional ArsR family regulator